MPAYCTCGAELPPDARFCHKCGKPQFDLTVAAIATDAVRVPVVTTADQVTGQAAATPILVGFHDRAAVKIGLFAALSGVLLSSLLSLLSAVWLFAAGFAAVYFYRRRTGFANSVRNGLRLGCITGLLASLILTVLLTFSVVVINAAGGLGAVRDQLRNSPMAPAQVEQVAKVLQTPSALIVVLISMVVFVIMLCTAGGLVGAKIVGRD